MKQSFRRLALIVAVSCMAAAAQETAPPPSSPTVTYRNGLLTIEAQNATLGQVLSAVRAQTGALVEIPPGMDGERVATRLGPGPADEVLASLLTGSKFNYIIMGRSGQAGIQRVILTRKPEGPAPPPPPPSSAMGPGFRRERGPDFSPGAEPEEEIIEEDLPPEVILQEEGTQVPPEAQTEQPGMQPVPGPIPGQPIPGQPMPPDLMQQLTPEQRQQLLQQQQIKTPEQLLEELKRLQEMQQQQQQQQTEPE